MGKGMKAKRTPTTYGEVKNKYKPKQSAMQKENMSSRAQARARRMAIRSKRASRESRYA